MKLPRHIITLLLTTGLLLLQAAPAQAQDAIRWSGKQLDVVMGSAIDTTKTLKVRADGTGQIFVSLDASGMQLDDFSRLAIQFGEVPAGARFFIAWRTKAGKEGMYHFSAPASAGQEVSISLAGEANWSGAAGEIGLGILIPPGVSASVESISLLQPTLLSAPRDRLREWSAFKGWQAADINRYTGTIAVDQKHAPVPIFAGLLLAALAVYLLYLLLRRRLRQFNWSVAGGLLLACWIALDLLWQARLGAQLADTRATFAGKSSNEKLLASVDAPIVQLIAEVKTVLVGETPRVFLASGNDFAAMLGAYYIAPVNTYWHRKGPELPAREFLAKGDYILLIPPFVTPYQPAASVITLPDASTLPVRPLLQDPSGLLLQVM